MASIGSRELRECTPTVKLAARDVRALARASHRHVTPEVLEDRYELRHRLGAGGSAEVYVAWDRVLERTVTVKRMRRDVAIEPHGLDRFRREALALAEIESDRVLKILDLRIGPDGCYQVLEHVRGSSMDRIVEDRGPLGALAALRIARDVLEGLARLHAAEITHRDVKPANVLLGEDGRAILLDLGIARSPRRGTLTPASHTVGTPAYMAPEQRVSSEVDGRADLYQVGLLLLYATTAIEPETSEELALALEHLEPRITSVVVRALAPLGERFQSASEMIASVVAAMRATIEIQLEDVASCELLPVEVIPPPTARRGDRGRWWILVASIAMIGLVVWALADHARAPALHAFVAPVSAAPAHAPQHAVERTGEGMPLLVAPDPVPVPRSRTSAHPDTTPIARPRGARQRRAPASIATEPLDRQGDAARLRPRREMSEPGPGPSLVDGGSATEADAFLRRALAYERHDAPELAIAAFRAFLRIERTGDRAVAARARLGMLERARR